MKMLKLMKETNPETSIAVNYIDSMDFTLLKQKLCLEKPNGQGWELDYCDEVEKWYKRFLLLTVLLPEESLVPNYAIDVFWHYHILDTKRYQKDCSVLVGQGNLIHHYPYFGLDGQDSEEYCKASLKRTFDLFEEYFGED